MRCCLLLFIFLSVFSFVQIRLRQERDALNFPRKFHLQYKLNATNKREEKQSIKMNVTAEKLSYGNAKSKIENNIISLNKAFAVSFSFRITGTPLTFQTVQIESENSIVFSNTVLLNNEGFANAHGSHEFYYLRPSCFFTHYTTGGISTSNQKAVNLEGIVSIRNIAYMVENSLDSQWTPL